jgi:DNA polymerase III subunit epsilon
MRNLILDRPICFFDLETTGVDKMKDRIVSIAILKVFPDGLKHPFSSLINPGIPIPASSTEIHKITNEMVKEAPSFAEMQDFIRGIFSGSDIGGFNSNYFDIPLLSMEFSRAGVSFPDPGVKCVDVGNIYKIKNPRTLAAAYKQYTGKDLDGAHDAEVDNRATFDVFLKQLELHEDLPLTIAELADVSCYGQKTLDIDGKFAFDDKGRIVFNFGKNKGNPVGTDLQYLGWMINKGDFLPNTKDWASKLYDKEINPDGSKQGDLPF